MIDWESQESHLLFNPRMPRAERALAERQLQGFPAHFWIATSGSSGTKKWAALAKEAVLVSAEAVNLHLQSDASDIWLHALPDFHVGGLGIWARAHLSGAKVRKLEGKWDPQRFLELSRNATLSALVPAQLHDLVQNGFSAPESLRAVILGGDALSDALYQKARALNWPILPSYGLTECCSQVATAKGEASDLQILPHIALGIDGDGRIKIKSRSLLSCYAFLGETVRFHDPKEAGWFLTEDIGEIRGQTLKVLGRCGDLVKILGEKVNLKSLEATLWSVAQEKRYTGDLALAAEEDPRKGSCLRIYATKDPADLLHAFHSEVMPYERIEKVSFVHRIPRNALGKVLKNELVSLSSKT